MNRKRLLYLLVAYLLSSTIGYAWCYVANSHHADFSTISSEILSLPIYVYYYFSWTGELDGFLSAPFLLSLFYLLFTIFIAYSFLLSNKTKFLLIFSLLNLLGNYSVIFVIWAVASV